MGAVCGEFRGHGKVVSYWSRIRSWFMKPSQYCWVFADPDYVKFLEQYEKGGNGVLPSLSMAEKANGPNSTSTGSAAAPLKTNLMEALEGKRERLPPKIVEVLTLFHYPSFSCLSPCMPPNWLTFCFGRMEKDRADYVFRLAMMSVYRQFLSVCLT